MEKTGAADLNNDEVERIIAEGRDFTPMQARIRNVLGMSAGFGGAGALAGAFRGAATAPTRNLLRPMLRQGGAGAAIGAGLGAPLGVWAATNKEERLRDAVREGYAPTREGLKQWWRDDEAKTMVGSLDSEIQQGFLDTPEDIQASAAQLSRWYPEKAQEISEIAQRGVDGLQKTGAVRLRVLPPPEDIASLLASGVDPTSSYTTTLGQEAAEEGGADHRLHAALAGLGGAVGGTVLIPAVSTGTLTAIREAGRSKGPASARLVAALRGAVAGAKDPITAPLRQADALMALRVLAQRLEPVGGISAKARHAMRELPGTDIPGTEFYRALAGSPVELTPQQAEQMVPAMRAALSESSAALGAGAAIGGLGSYSQYAHGVEMEEDFQGRMRKAVGKAKRDTRKQLREKTALPRPLAPIKDFVGGLDPTGTFTTGWAQETERRQREAGTSSPTARHLMGAGLAGTGGLIGGGLLLPSAITGVVQGMKAGLTTPGSAGKRLGAAGRAFATGAKTPLRQIRQGRALDSWASGVAARGGTAALPSRLVPALEAAAAKIPAGEALKGHHRVLDFLRSPKGKSTAALDTSDVARLNMLANKSDLSLDELMESRDLLRHLSTPEAHKLVSRVKLGPAEARHLQAIVRPGLTAGIGGLGLGAAVGGGGALAQYKKGVSIEDDVQSRLQEARRR